MKTTIIIILLLLTISLSAQEKGYTFLFKPFAGLAVLNRRPSPGFSAGNTFILSREQKKLSFAAGIRYTFASEIQEEKSIVTIDGKLINYGPKYNSLISAVDFSVSTMIHLFEKGNFSMSCSAGLNVRKWSETTNVCFDTIHIVDDVYPYDVYTARTEFIKIWQPGCNAALETGIRLSKSVKLTFSTAYAVYPKNNVWYNELGCSFKLPKR